MLTMLLERYTAALLRLALAAALAGTLQACADCTLSVSTTSLPSGVVGVRYFAELDSDCGGDDWFYQSGDLPPGIGVQINGDVQGVPNTAGLYIFTVLVLDYGSGEAASQGLAIQIDPAA